MRHRIAGRRLHRDTAQRRALFRSLITEFFRHERIETTEAKAKAVRGDIEKLITLARRTDIRARRTAMLSVTDPEVTKKLFDTLGPRYKDTKGGYTRLYKVGPRLGDAAPIVIMELINRES
jgi:large subunit ribosomal protein L17